MTIAVILTIIAGAAVIGFQNRKYLISRILPTDSLQTNPQQKTAEGEKSKIFRSKMPPTVVGQTQNQSRPKRSAKPSVKTAAANQKSRKTKRVVPSEKSGSPAAMQTSKPGSIVTTRSPQGATTAKQPGKPPASPKFTPSEKSIVGKRTASRQPAAVDRKRPRARTYARLTDTRLALQALAWSSDASRRMAVINGRIVREGESVDGYQIIQIRKEDVVVRDDQQSWSLEFGLQQ